jgi:hypothetical protein
MAPREALAELALRKRLLLAESEAQRLVLASELKRLLRPLHWLDRVQTRFRPLLALGAPLAGFWLTRRSKGVKRWAVAGFGVLRLLQSLRKGGRRPDSARA